jgi:5-methylcytosine-specific restriction endonuclease McrA
MSRKKYISTDDPKWVTLRDKVFMRDNFQCRKCNSEKQLSAHHIVPRKKGGKDEQRNLITLCLDCHNWAEAFNPTWEELLAPIPKKTKKPLWWGKSKSGIIFHVPAGDKKAYLECLQDKFE